jgi:hypothetical protein
MQAQKLIRHLLLLAIGVALSGFAAAHSDEHLATVPAPHGGVLRMAGPLHLELVLEPGRVKVYLTDHAFQPVSAAGATGSARVLLGGKRLDVPLKPAGGNLLSGTGGFDTGPDSGVTVRVKLPGSEAVTAQFPPLRPNPAPETQSQGHEKR